MTLILQDFLAFFSLSYIIPSILLNIVLFYILLTHFKSSFYIIFTINGITSNIWVIIGFIKNRASVAPTLFGLCRIFPATGAFPTIWFFLNYMLLIPCRLGDFLLTLNRFTIFYVAPRKQDKMWRYLLPVLLAFGYIVATGLNMPILVNGARFKSPNGTENFYILESFSHEVEIRQSAYGIGSIIAFFPASLVMNCKIALFLWKNSQANKGKTGNFVVEKGIQDAEAKLCFITFTLFVTNFVGLVCQIWFFVAGVTKSYMGLTLIMMLTQIATFAEDLHLFSQPWLLIAMSSSIREELKRLLFYPRDSSIHNSIISLKTSELVKHT